MFNKKLLFMGMILICKSSIFAGTIINDPQPSTKLFYSGGGNYSTKTITGKNKYGQNIYTTSNKEVSALYACSNEKEARNYIINTAPGNAWIRKVDENITIMTGDKKKGTTTPWIVFSYSQQ
jgi:hypothetical protein